MIVDQKRNATPKIRLRHVTIGYPRAPRPVFADFSLDIWPREAILLLGPSGCGKSTLALLVSGIVPHVVAADVQGIVELDGIPLDTLSPAARVQRIGVVFQDPEAQFCTFRVGDEVAFGPENLCMEKRVILERVRMNLLRTGLAGFDERIIYRLSGGEKQRVAAASVLALEPEVLVLDSVTANLDPVGAQQMFHVMRELHREKTLLIIEQKLDDLVDFIDRVVVLDDKSRIAHDGPPETIFASRHLASSTYGFWQPQVAELFHGLPPTADGTRVPLSAPEAVQILSAKGYHISSLAPRPAARPIRPEQPIAIAVDGLSYVYSDGTRALDDVCIKIPAGAFYAIVGQNGSGKTTLAQHLTGIKRTPRGRIKLFERDIRSLTVRSIASEVGYVFQNPEHQFVAQTVADELAYGLKVRGDPLPAVHIRVKDACVRFGFSDPSEDPHRLSAGEMRRLSVATMLMVEPRVLILDEPTFGQDYRSAKAIMDILVDLHRTGRTVIMITHDMRLVAEYAERVIVMSGGRIIFEGIPACLFAEDAIMKQASLTPPPVFAIARALNPEARIATLPEFYERLKVAARDE